MGTIMNKIMFSTNFGNLGIKYGIYNKIGLEDGRKTTIQAYTPV